MLKCLRKFWIVLYFAPTGWSCTRTEANFRENRPSDDGTEIPGYLTVERDVSPEKSESIQFGEDEVNVPEKSAQSPYRVRLTRETNQQALKASEAVVLTSLTSDLVRVELYDPQSNELLKPSDLNRPYEVTLSMVVSRRPENIGMMVVAAPGQDAEKRVLIPETELTVKEDPVPASQLALADQIRLSVTISLTLTSAKFWLVGYSSSGLENLVVGKNHIEEPISISGTSALVLKPGDLATIYGSNLRPSLAIKAGSTEIPSNLIDSHSATFIMPNLPAGMVVLDVYDQSAIVTRLELISDSADDGIPIIAADASTVCSNQQFRNADGELKQGTRECGAPSPCSSDGQTACLTGANFPAVEKASVAAKVFSTYSVAGVVGSVQNPPLCSTHLEQGCIVSGSYHAIDPTNLSVQNLKAGVVVGDLTGSYPSSSNKLALADNTADLTSLNASTAAGNYEWFGPDGTRYTGTISDAGTITPTTSNQTFSTSLYRPFSVVGDADLTPGNIKSGVNIFGVTGDYPSTTYKLTGADSTADLDSSTFNAKVKSATSFEWFGPDGARYTGAGDVDLASAANIRNQVTVFDVTGNYVGSGPTDSEAWNIRAGKTVAGVSGKIKTNCRNLVSTATTPLFNYDGATDGDASALPDTATTSGTQLEWWDTIAETPGLTVDIPTITPNAWDDKNVCSGSTTTYSDSEVWQDLTSGTCDSSGKECVFLDKITGLEWTETIAGTGTTWAQSLRACVALNTFASHADWRLPTEKELIDAHIHGIATVMRTNWLDAADSYQYVSATTTDFTGDGNFGMNFNSALPGSVSKGTAGVNGVTCVRVH